jgi:hypothetical protein
MVVEHRQTLSHRPASYFVRSWNIRPRCGHPSSPVPRIALLVTNVSADVTLLVMEDGHLVARLAMIDIALA